MTLSAELLSFIERVRQLEAERDAAIARAARAEHAEGDALDLVAELRDELRRVRDGSSPVLTLQEVP